MRRSIVVAMLAVAASCAEPTATPPALDDQPAVHVADLNLSFAGGRGAVNEFLGTGPQGPVQSVGTRIWLDIKGRQPGECCTDTALSIRVAGLARLGTTTIPTPPIRVLRGNDARTGAPAVMLENADNEARVLIFDSASGAFPARELVQDAPALLEVLEFRAPTEEADGFIRGRVEFHAAQYVRRYSPAGEVSLLRLDETIRVRASFQQAMAYTAHHLIPPPDR